MGGWGKGKKVKKEICERMRRVHEGKERGRQYEGGEGKAGEERKSSIKKEGNG